MKVLDIFQKMPKSVKASIGFFFANIITYGIAYLTTPIYTRMLSTAEYGQAATFLSCVSLIGVVAMFSLSSGVYNNGMVDYPEKRDQFTLSMLVLSNVITLLCSAFLIICYKWYHKYINLNIELIILMCVLFFFQPAYNFWSSRQRYELEYKKTIIWSAICGVLSPLVSILCIRLYPENRLNGRLFGAEVTLIVIYIFFYINSFKKANYRVETKYWKSAFLFNLPLIPHYFSQYMLSSSDKLMISYLVSDSATAFYSVAHSVAAICSVVWTAVNATLIPFTYEKCKENNHKAIAKVTEPILLVFAAICIFIVLLAPEIVAIMGTEAYLEAIYVVPPVICGVFFQVQYFVYANVIYYYKKPKYVMYASVTSTILNLLLNFIFIRRYGYVAAGYTTLVSYIVQAILDYFAMKKVVKQSIYNMKNIIILSIVVVIFGLLCSFSYKHTLVRLSLIALVLAISTLNRNKVFNLLHTLRN